MPIASPAKHTNRTYKLRPATVHTADLSFPNDVVPSKAPQSAGQLVGSSTHACTCGVKEKGRRKRGVLFRGGGMLRQNKCGKKQAYVR
jgi:hypothetical protein